MAIIVAILFFVATFLAATLAVLVAAFVQDRLRGVPVFGPEPEAQFELETGGEPVLLRQPMGSTISPLELLLQRLNVVELLDRQLADAGLRWSVGRVAATMLLCGAIGAAIGMNLSWAPNGTAIVLFVAAASLPYFYIQRRRHARLEEFESQFPEALESLARAMRAGHPMQAAFDLMAADAPAPLGTQFRRMSDERRLGMSWKATLENFAERVPLDEVRLFVAAAVLNSRSGGKLTEVMENLAENIRESVSLRGEVRAISAHGRLTGLVLSILPFGIAFMLWITSPGYLNVLFDHRYGPLMIATAICLVIAGHFVIQRIVTIRI